MVIPKFLQNSELYKKTNKYSLKKIPNKYKMSKIDISNINDLKQTMKILKYWKVYDMPWEIYDFIKSNQDLDYNEIFENLGHKEFINEMNLLIKYKDFTLTNHAAKHGYLNLLKYLHRVHCLRYEYACAYAAKYGNYECLKFLHESGCPWDESTCSYATSNCDENNIEDDDLELKKLKCLKYAHINNCPWNKLTCSNAALNGYLILLEYAIENKCEFDINTTINAYKNSNLDCYNYAVENGCPHEIKID